MRVASTSERHAIGCQPALSASQLCTSARAASRAAAPTPIRSASQPNPCQAASHSGPAPAGNQTGDRVAHQLAGEFDLAGQDRGAALGIARPALADAEPQIRRHRGRSACGDRAARPPARARHPRRSRVSRSGALAGGVAPRRVAVGCRAARSRPHRAAPGRGAAHGGSAMAGRATACPAVEPMPLRNKETHAAASCARRRRAPPAKSARRLLSAPSLTSRAA